MSPARSLVVSLLAQAVVIASTAAVAAPAGLADRIATYSQPLADSGYLSGCLLVSRPDENPVHLCYGYSDANRTTPVDLQSRLCIASLTKPMTAVAILRLVEQGRLRLADPVRTWIADFPSADSISVADLLTHAAGVPHRVTTPEEEVNRYTPAEIVDRVKQQGLLFPPHSRREYSSAGYTVLAYIMERVTGQNYGDAMDQLVFEPLGMNDTFHPDGRAIDRRAISFVAGPEGPVEAPAKDFAFLAGAGSLYSTCEDLLRFARAYLDRNLLSEATWAEFHALGWAAGDVVRWSGSTSGFGCWLDIYKQDKAVYVFLGNTGPGASNLLRAALPALVAGEEVPPPPPAPDRTPLTAAQMQGLAGQYARAGSGTPLNVTQEAGELHMGEHVVYPIAVDRFFNPAYFSEVQFERGEHGVATRITMTATGLPAPMVFNRVE